MSHNILAILGAGQLALYIAKSARKMAIPFRIIAQSESDPAFMAFPSQSVLCQLNDESTLSLVTKDCSHIALENEFWTPAILKSTFHDKKVCPELHGYEMVHGKIRQRQLMKSLHIAQPQYFIIHSKEEFKKAFNFLGQNIVMKRNTGGYDGLGNKHITHLEEGYHGLDSFNVSHDNPILIEKNLNLTRELALTFFSQEHDISFFPPVETLQEDHVCHTAISPANLAVAERERLENVAKKLVSKGLRGLYTIEFFREETGPWMYNEIAPRPHNSQHLSMDNCLKSQYDVIISWVKGEVLPQRINALGDAAMVNILGQRSALTDKLMLPEIGSDIEVRTYLYGKKESRPGRKLGHLTLLGPRNRILDEAKKVSKEYRI